MCGNSFRALSSKAQKTQSSSQRMETRSVTVELSWTPHSGVHSRCFHDRRGNSNDESIYVTVRKFIPGIIIESSEDTVYVTKNGNPVSDSGTILDTTFRKWSGSSRQLLPTNYRETIANAVNNISTSKIQKMI